MVIKNKYLLLIAILVLVIPGIASNALQLGKRADDSGVFDRFEFRSFHMGTQFRIVIYGSEYNDARSAADSAFAMAEYLNSIFSNYDPESELSQLTRNIEPGQYIPVSVHMYRVLDTAQTVASESNGAYDITIGPLTHIWRDFIRGNRTDLPTSDELEAARKSIGFRNLSLNPETRSVALHKNGMKLDAGGIAKGYTAEQMSEVLLSHGYVHTLIDAGGDIVLGDAPPGSEGWNMVVPVYDQEGQKSHISFSMEKTVITTSGDLFQFVEHGGKRYSHIIDPSTGIGLTNQTSVTIIGGDGAAVDAWATALNVLGGKKGIELLTRYTTFHARVEVMDYQGISIHKSVGFDNL